MSSARRVSLLLMVVAVIGGWVMAGRAAGAEGPGLKVVTTTTLLQDFVQNVGGDKVMVQTLVPRDGDVHNFEPHPDDIRKASEAALIFVNGAGLETFLDRIIAGSGTSAKVVLASKGLSIQKLRLPAPDAALDAASLGILGASGDYQCQQPAEGASADECDPHFWQNPLNVVTYVNNIRDALIDADPTNAAVYRANADTYTEKLHVLDSSIEQALQFIPAEKRLLVTNHDALGYFATRYRFRLVGVIFPGGGAGAIQDPDPKTIAQLIEKLRSMQIRAIFIENVANDRLAQQIAEQSGVQVVSSLYTDALGEEGTPGATYLGMMEANLNTLVQAFK